ncbi:MAG TPA: hypothetical protein VHI78_07405, partial [Bacteroidales bacterium]|nr:hypothetical protein [Bacteroidales bacterium]
MAVKKIISCIFLFACLTFYTYGQENIPTIEEKLNSLTGEIPALNQRITISVSNVSIHEFVRAIANSSGLNINVDPGIAIMVSNNFNDVRVLDILLFLSREYLLNISVIGNIVSVYKSSDDTALQKGKITYDSTNSLLSIDLREENLQDAVKLITRATNRNVILSPGLEGTIVSGYILNMPFDNALEKLAYSNSLQMEKTTDNFYLLSRVLPEAT